MANWIGVLEQVCEEQRRSILYWRERAGENYAEASKAQAWANRWKRAAKQFREAYIETGEA